MVFVEFRVYDSTQRNFGMNTVPADAFVFFGATGDLAYKKIFPSLQALIRRGSLDIPIIGVAREEWSLDQLRERAHSSLEQFGGVDADAQPSRRVIMHDLAG